jgi:hypothetical protein
MLSKRAFARAFLLSLSYLGLASCAHTETSAQNRIERHIASPNPDEINIGSAHYNNFAKGFEEPWPFGPYSN